MFLVNGIDVYVSNGYRENPAIYVNDHKTVMSFGVHCRVFNKDHRDANDGKDPYMDKKVKIFDKGLIEKVLSMGIKAGSRIHISGELRYDYDKDKDKKYEFIEAHTVNYPPLPPKDDDGDGEGEAESEKKAASANAAAKEETKDDGDGDYTVLGGGVLDDDDELGDLD